MKPVDQTQFVPEAGDRAGNCLQACVASILGLPLDEVPNFAAAPDGDEDGRGRVPWFLHFEEWLLERGLGIAVWYFSEGAVTDWYATPGTLLIASGKSPRGDFQHSIVWRDYEVVHDPHPSRAGLDGLAKELWLIYPLDLARNSDRAREGDA